jgi:hypothetical protein
MRFPAQIVRKLLEDDPDFDADEYMATDSDHEPGPTYRQQQWHRQRPLNAQEQAAKAARAAAAAAAREAKRTVGPPNQWAAKLGNRSEKVLDHNTRLVRNYDNISIRFYDTDILTAEPDGSVSVRTNGYNTPITLQRINYYLPHNWKLGIVQGQVFWYNWQTGAGRIDSGYSLPFTDGDVILTDGTLQNQEPQIPRRQRRQRVQP